MTVMTASTARTGNNRKPVSLVPMANGVRTAILDPLDDDSSDDDVVVTTRRAISRVALVAVETAGRFQREAIAHDPMTWMMAPRTLFDDVSALDACLGRDACLRGILLHGLSLGLDADPSVIDALVADDDEDDGDGDDGIVGDAGGRAGNVLPFMRASEEAPRLFTATVVASDGFETIQAFHASLATDEAEVAGRLYCRIGAASADARIVAGFDATDPMVAALVSPAICDTLALVASDPASPLAAGLDLNVEQRFLG